MLIESDCQEGGATLGSVHDASKPKNKSERKFYLSAICKYLDAKCKHLISVKCT